MMISARSKQVRYAKRQLERQVLGWLEDVGDDIELTTAEELLIISEVLTSTLTGTLRLVVRDERGELDASAPPTTAD